MLLSFFFEPIIPLKMFFPMHLTIQVLLGPSLLQTAARVSEAETSSELV